MAYKDMNLLCPGVVPQLHGFLALEGHAVFFLELAGAGSMAPLWGRLGERSYAYVTACLARHIMALARAGWQHGDLKPANILLQPDGTVLLGDLNIAQRTDRAGRARGCDGTERYQAPEHKAPYATFDYRAEFFAVGRIVCDLARDVFEWSRAGQEAMCGLLLPDPEARVTEAAHPVFDAWMKQFGFDVSPGAPLVPPSRFVEMCEGLAADMRGGGDAAVAVDGAEEP